MGKNKKDYWNDLGMNMLRAVIKEIYIPEKLNVEYYIKKNGQVVLRKVKHAKKKKK
jgi:hypothetical protein